ncbi:MAG: enoyl-CoA hydratase/isomerase family protein [Dehalococcoidia bacterium]|nr:MAG: enoyl-CoA hydratase/isomerase family protein [Dehalococcoidia bacterium]
MAKDYETIIYDKKPPIGYLTLNRPTKLNALSPTLQLEVRDALEDAGWKDSDIRVIILKGAGRAFSAGFDISQVNRRDVVATREGMLKGNRFTATIWWDVFWNNPKPIIAQIHGFCIAGGMATAVFCDLRICAEDALFGVPEVRMLGPYLPAIWPWMIGPTVARELLYTGNLIDAQEAYRIGLVNKVVPRDYLDEEVKRTALTIAKVPQAIVEYNKKLVNMAYELMNVRLVTDRSMELEAATVTSPQSVPEWAEFQRITQEQGLTAAIRWNSNRFAEEDTWWRTRNLRESKGK